MMVQKKKTKLVVLLFQTVIAKRYVYLMSSIFTAEAKAKDLALDFINECKLKDKFIIFSDSMSVLQALNHTSSKNPQIQKLFIKHHTISELKTIIYCWVPSHVGIYGNEKVDKNAKESLNLEDKI